MKIYLILICHSVWSKKTDMNYLWHEKTSLLQTFFSKCIKKKKQNPSHLRLLSRLVAIDTLVLLHPAPPQHVDVFGPQPAVSGQRGLSQAQRQQPADRVSQPHPTQTHLSLNTLNTGITFLLLSISGIFTVGHNDLLLCLFNTSPFKRVDKSKYMPSNGAYVNLITAHLATTSSLWRSSADTLWGSSFLISTKSSSTDWGHTENNMQFKDTNTHRQLKTSQ